MYNNMEFKYKTKKLDYYEYSKIIHEINTCYRKYDGKKLAVHYSFGIDGKCYMYYFENFGFDNYNIYSKKLVISWRK